MARDRITGRRPSAAPKLTLEQRLLLEQLRGEGYAALPEVRFHPTRKWRIDVACTRDQQDHGRLTSGVNVSTYDDLADCYAIEIDGGAWSRGRHVRGAGFVADMEKQNALTELGWKILRFSPQQVRDGTALATIKRCL